MLITDKFENIVSSTESTLDDILDQAFEEDADIEDDASTSVNDTFDTYMENDVEDIVNAAIHSGLITDGDIDDIDKGHKLVKDQIDKDADNGEKSAEVKKYAKELTESGILSEGEIDSLLSGAALEHSIEIAEPELDDFDEADDLDILDTHGIFAEGDDDDDEVYSDDDEDHDDDDSDNDSDEDLDDDDEDDDDDEPDYGRHAYHDGDDDNMDNEIPTLHDESFFDDDLDLDTSNDFFEEDYLDDSEFDDDEFNEAFDDLEDISSMDEASLANIDIMNDFEGSSINSKQKGQGNFLVGPKDVKEQNDLDLGSNEDTLPSSYAKDSWWDDDEDPNIDDMD